MRREVVAMLVVALASMAPGGLAGEATGETARDTTPTAVTTRIELVDALASADGDTSRAVVALTRDARLMHETGLGLTHMRAPGQGPSSEPIAEVQARTKVALVKGEIGGAVLPLSSMLRQSALFGADQIPLLAVDDISSARLIEALTPRIDDRLAETDLALLGLLPMRPVGLTGSPRRPTGLPKTVAVSDAAGRRLAELIGARAVDTAAKDVPALLARNAVEAGFSEVPGLGSLDQDRPPPSPPPHDHQPHEHKLLAMTGWPLAMIVVRRELLAEKSVSVRNRLWQEAARHAEATRQRWRRSIVHAGWPRSAGLMGEALATNTELVRTDTAASKPTASDASVTDLPAAATTTADTTAQAAAADTQATDPRLREASRRLRAAALTMARDWASGAGADGFALLTQLGVRLRDDAP